MAFSFIKIIYLFFHLFFCHKKQIFQQTVLHKMKFFWLLSIFFMESNYPFSNRKTSISSMSIELVPLAQILNSVLHRFWIWVTECKQCKPIWNSYPDSKILSVLSGHHCTVIRVIWNVCPVLNENEFDISLFYNWRTKYKS